MAVAQATPAEARAQERTRIERERLRIDSAAAVFFDVTRSANERLDAVRRVPAFMSTQHGLRAVQMARTPAEPVALRVRALQLSAVPDQTDVLVTQIAGIASDMSLTTVIRSEAVRQLAGMSFDLHGLPQAHLQALRSAARDAEIDIRRLALRALAGHGDSVAIALLTTGLQTPATALLPPVEAIRLLGLKDPKPSFPLLDSVMRQAGDTLVRAAAVQLLGGHPPSRSAILGFFHDAQQPLTVRRAAFGALAAGDKTRVPTDALPVVTDESAPAELRVRVIKFVELTRTSRDPRIFARAADSFDQAMSRLASSSSTPEVREAARNYLARSRTAR